MELGMSKKDNLKRVFSFAFVLLGLTGCPATAERTVVDVPSLPSYMMIAPADEGIVSSASPTFVLERDTNNAPSAISCNSVANPVLYPVELTVLQVVNGPVGATTQTVVQQTIQVPNDCKFELQPTSLTLVENDGYAWRVSKVGEVADEASKWNSFVYSTTATEVDSSDPYTCAGNMVTDWSFSSANAWQTSLLPTPNISAAYQRAPNGDVDAGSSVISTQNNVVYQTLAQPIVQGSSYQLKLSLQHQGKLDFKIKALAFNGATISSLQPNSNVALIGQTGNMTYQQGNWVHITLPVWQAIGNFTSLAIAIVDDQQQQVNVLIDKVCLSPATYTGCAPSVDAPGVVPIGLDFNYTVPVVTTSEYLNGAVNDLYPNYDTSTANWFEQAGATDPALACSSVGGGLTPQEQYDLDLELIDPELDALMLESDAATPQMDANIAATDTYTGDLQPIQNTLVKKCTSTNRVVNPNLPFSGRDIVYIHGLQIDALTGNLSIPGTFQEKWPADAALFYSGGDIINKAKLYWSEHVQRELGATFDIPTNQFTSTPTNSFLVTSWSANQRSRYAIHAVLTQIRDAMSGLNPNVVQSAEAGARGQCFGDNGIVVVTHSTGGLIASAMFGVAERSADPYANISSYGPSININSTYGDVRFITSKIDAQVGINSAYGGSPFAEVALKHLTGLANSPLAALVAADFFQTNGVNLNVAPILTNAFNRSSLVDLVPSVAASRWRPWQASSIPTLTMSGTFLDKAVFSPNAGKKMITGFDDLVLSPSSQSNSYIRRPVFKIKNILKLYDIGVGGRRAIGMLKDGNKASGVGFRNYYNTPYLAPTGMLQWNSVQQVTDPTNWHIPNHHLVLQTTGDHFDNVNKMAKNGNNYSFTRNPIRAYLPGAPHFVGATDQSNYEETGVVFNSALYSTGLLNPAFGQLNRELVRDEKWGFHFIKIRFVRTKVGPFWLKLPRVTWHYYEYLKWRRKYHLLEGYQTKMGADYMYDYVLR